MYDVREYLYYANDSHDSLSESKPLHDTTLQSKSHTKLKVFSPRKHDYNIFSVNDNDLAAAFILTTEAVILSKFPKACPNLATTNSDFRTFIRCSREREKITSFDVNLELCNIMAVKLEKKNKMTGLGNFESLRFNFDMPVVIFRNCQIPSLSQS